jgi:hypothetical protein
MTRYLCKGCGAESPAGIGYVVTMPGVLPAPDPACPNLHGQQPSTAPLSTSA